MEAESGRILFQKDENKPVPIASVTKVMVTLLIMEAIDSGRVSMDEEVTVASAPRRWAARRSIWSRARR